MKITTDYELERFCDTHACDYSCMSCPAFIALHRYELGYEDDEEEECDEEYDNEYNDEEY